METKTNLVATIRGLPRSRQALLAGAILALCACMAALVQGATRPDMGLLYSGLTDEATGEIIEELDQRGVPYRIESGSILVPAAERERLRFALARDGMPRQSLLGYELLDTVNGFSVTSEMYNASYWRAKEGELTRTILAVPGVQSVRVHIGANLRSGFARTSQDRTASVFLNSTHDLSGGQAEAIQYLVALAVAGLNPGDVAVIDSEKGILAGQGSSANQAPHVQSADRAAALEAKLRDLLDARMGPGNARVSVALDMSTERRRTVSVEFDPASRVVRQRTTSDVSEESRGGSAALTVASNLPQTAQPAGEPGRNTTRNSTETVAYDVSETRTEIESLPGQIQRLSIAVLLNAGAIGLGDADAIRGEAGQAALADFEKLVSTAAGLDVARGDKLTVEFMPFAEVFVEEMIELPAWHEALLERHSYSLFQALFLSLVVLALGLGVIRPLLRPISPMTEADQGSGNISAGQGSLQAMPRDPIEYLRTVTSDREEDAASLIASWLSDDQKAAVNE